MHRSIASHVVLAFTMLLVSGCYSPYIRYPNFAHPGTAAEQRADAERFDPYPDPDMGPEVVGGRPQGFQRPLTETEWSRRYGVPPGGLSAASPIVTTPPVMTNPFPPSGPQVFTNSLPPSAPPVFVPAPAPIIPSPTAPSQIQPRSPY